MCYIHLAYIGYLEDIEGSWLETWRMGSFVTSCIMFIDYQEDILKVCWRSDMLWLRKGLSPGGVGFWFFVKFNNRFKPFKRDNINYIITSCSTAQDVGWIWNPSLLAISRPSPTARRRRGRPLSCGTSPCSSRRSDGIHSVPPLWGWSGCGSTWTCC